MATTQSCGASHNGQEFTLTFCYSPAEKTTFDYPGCEAEVEIDWDASSITVSGHWFSIGEEMAGCLSQECCADLERQCLASAIANADYYRDNADLISELEALGRDWEAA